MKKIVLFTVLLLSFFILFPFQSHAQLQCDQCGYCVGQPQPSNWAACKACLYGDGDSFAIRTTIPGNYYTQLGCIKTGIANTATQTGVGLNASVTGSIANFLLNKFLFPLAGILSFLYIIYGAYLLMTSQDNPERKLQGRGTVTGAIVGVIFTILSVFLVNFIAADVLKIPGFARGPKITINARGSCAQDYPLPATEPCIYPTMEIVIDNNVVNRYNVVDSNVKDYIYHPSVDITDSTVIAVRFVKDEDRPDLSPHVDRNLFLKQVTVNDKVCSLNYRGGVAIKADMFWSGDATCVSFL